LKSDFVTSCSNFIARITPTLAMQATHMYAARTYFSQKFWWDLSGIRFVEEIINEHFIVFKKLWGVQKLLFQPVGSLFYLFFVIWYLMIIVLEWQCDYIMTVLSNTSDELCFFFRHLCLNIRDCFIKVPVDSVHHRSI
jgi:hypothetical protein